jgi:hypothetical protein
MTVEDRLDNIDKGIATLTAEMGEVKAAVKLHNERHFQVGLQSLLALIGAGFAIVAAWFK